MKPLPDILRKIHSWPEEARQILAGILFLVCAAALWGLWNFDLASRLENLPENNLSAEDMKQGQPETKTLTPLAGVRETFRSLGILLNY